MPKLPVEGLPPGDSGRLLVRLNTKYRQDVGRYQIARLTNNDSDKKLNVLILGHDREDAIFMPYDIRTALGIAKKGEKIEFSIQKVGWIGMLRWYCCSPDPAVKIPAFLAVLSLIFSVIGIFLGLASLHRV